MEKNFQQAISRAVLSLLRPLIRILLRNGVAFGTFSDLAKKVYTDVAFEDFTLDGKKQTISRVSILTGLTRKEVKRLSELESMDSLIEEKRYNRAIRVISGWINDEQFCSTDGIPLPLPLEGNEISFAKLVKLYSGDVPVQAMLNELSAGNSVEVKHDVVYLIRHAYIPSGDPIENIHILGSDTEELIATIDHNLTHSGNELRFQRKVSNHNLSQESAKAFKQLSAREAQMLLERLDAWLSEHELESLNDQHKAVKVCVGIYYYEDNKEVSSE